MKRIKRLSALAALSMAVASLVAIPSAKAAVTITVMTPNYTDAMPAFYKDLNDRFMAANPDIKVVQTNLSWDDILVKGRTLEIGRAHV